MSARVVAVPGVGNVEFPDSTSHDEISSAIQQHRSLASAAGAQTQ